MDFSDILNGIAQPPKAEEATYRANGSIASPEFWQVLDQLADAPPVSDARLKEAYFAEGFVAAPLISDIAEDELSLDPDDIEDELDLDAAVSLEELSLLRRRFAMLNHPDRMAPRLRERANRRMTLANALIDRAAARFPR